MRLRCPHCHNAVEVVDSTELTDVDCPSCGSHFNVISEDATLSHQPTQRTLGHFQLIEQVGVGAFGSVWKARDPELDRIVAIKIPRKSQLEAQEVELFMRDARAAAQLRHPNIVGVHEVGRADSTLYIAMDFVEGADLKDWLQAKPLPPREAAELMVTIANAVHHAHEQGVIHRDLKPGNVMMDRQGIPHVMDFGMAKRETGEITMTLDGATLGTPAYMSPEQAAGKAHNADARSDVYSLGVLLYEMLTGERPFRGEARMLIVQVLEDEPPPVRKLNHKIPRDLETICLKCLRKEPHGRYQTADALSQDLRRWLENQPIVARPVTRVERVWKWCKRNRAIAGLSAAIILIVISGSMAFWARQTSVYVEGLVSQLRVADDAEVARVVEELAQYGSWSHGSLRNVYQDSEDGSPEKLNAALALLATSDPPLAYVQQQILKLSEPDFGYISPICDNLGRHRGSTAAWVRQTFEDPGKPSSVRFRAGLALAYLEGDAYAWKPTDCQFLVTELVATNPVYQPPLWETLASIQAKLRSPLEVVFGDRERPESEQLAAANAIASFAAEDSDRLEKLLLMADGPQFRALYVKYQEADNEASLKRLRAKVKVQPNEAMEVAERIQLGKERATSAITLLRQGERESILDALRYDDDPEAMTQFIHRCRARGVTAAQLIELLEQVDQQRGPLNGDRKQIDDSVMYALILSLGEFAWDELPSRRKTLAERLGAIYAKDPSSGVHSATGWLLRQWGQQEAVDKVDQTPLPYDPTGHREWYVREIEYESGGVDGLLTETKKFYLTFIVFQPREFTMGSPGEEPDHQSLETQHQVTLTRPIAVCDRELTWAQWMAMEGPGRRDNSVRQFSKTPADTDPVFGVGWFHSVAYCRWLSEQAGLPEVQQCYADPSLLPKDGQGNPTNWPLRLEGAGFRLPTEAEWEFICRSGTSTAYSFGHDERLLDRYAWYLKNSGDWSHATGELRPNPRGLFDIHGNLFEWCHDSYNESELSDASDPIGAETGSLRVCRGGSMGLTAKFCRSASRYGGGPTGRSINVGFRVASVPIVAAPGALETDKRSR